MASLKTALFVLFVFTLNPYKADIKMAQTIADYFKVAVSDAQMKCLVDNVFYEAFSEGRTGRLLVANVTLNRANGTNNICREVYKPHQFSWTLQKRHKAVPDSARRLIAQELFELIYGHTKVPDEFKRSTHYHTIHVKPVWRHNLKVAGVWKQHIFYV